MAHISQHINSTNHKIHLHDEMRKIMVNLGSKLDRNWGAKRDQHIL